MTTQQKVEIEEISKGFARGLGIDLKGSGWLVSDPLSAYLNACGFKNTLSQLPANEKHPLILVMKFLDGTQFIPAGSDLNIEGAKDWLWIDK